MCDFYRLTFKSIAERMGLMGLQVTTLSNPTLVRTAHTSMAPPEYIRTPQEEFQLHSESGSGLEKVSPSVLGALKFHFNEHSISVVYPVGTLNFSIPLQ
jgi:hypothetical protein